MRPSRRSVRALAASTALSALLLSSCGGDDPEVSDPPAATQDAPEDEATDTGAPTAGESDPAQETEAEETGTEQSDAGAADTEEPPDSSAETATPTGPVTAEDGNFQITLPEGWVDVRDQVQQTVEIAARDDEMTDDFFTNVVVASEEPIGDLADSIEAAAEQVAGADGEYEMLDPIQIDGVDAYGFVLTRSTGGVQVAQTQWWVEHDDRLYVTTFSTAKTQQEASQGVMEEILTSWSWQD